MSAWGDRNDGLLDDEDADPDVAEALTDSATAALERGGARFERMSVPGVLEIPAAIAIASHPDDIEFVAAGTLLLLKQRGWEIHYMNLSKGSGGSVQMGPEETARKRLAEAQEAARKLGFGAKRTMQIAQRLYEGVEFGGVVGFAVAFECFFGDVEDDAGGLFDSPF